MLSFFNSLGGGAASSPQTPTDPTPNDTTFSLAGAVTADGKFPVWELGQSNMEGRSGADPLHTVPVGTAFSWGGAGLVHLVNNRGGAVGGSHATYFAERLYTQTGYKPVLVEAARGGSGTTDTAGIPDRQWDATGSLRGTALNLMNACLANMGVQRPAFTLICLGENDAGDMDLRGLTKADIKAAWHDLIDWCFLNFPDTPVLISRTGHEKTVDSVGYQTIRDIQEEIVAERANVYMAFRGADTFPERGMLVDSVHYRYDALEEMGQGFADECVRLINTLVT